MLQVMTEKHGRQMQRTNNIPVFGAGLLTVLTANGQLTPKVVVSHFLFMK